MADSCEWNFHLFRRHHSKSGIFERMKNFQKDCCCPWTKNLFKDSCSRHLRIVNAVVMLIASRQVRLIDQNLLVFKLKLLIFRQWWQPWMKSINNDKIKVLDEFIFHSVSLVFCFFFHRWTWWVNWYTIDVHVSLVLKLRLHMQTKNYVRCFYVLVRYFVVLDIHLWKWY